MEACVYRGRYLFTPNLAIDLDFATLRDLKLKSPSKINLFLRILRRREDGYHDLASLFQAISLHDELNISLLPESAADDLFECDAPGVPTDRTNLVLRALDVYRKNTGRTEKFHIELNKFVPVQAGLGGGSANAATALWGANALCGSIASDEQLAAYGAEIGSDISFFFSSGTAYCTGRGEVRAKQHYQTDKFLRVDTE